ncbi:MAG: aminotransferase class IV [Thermoflexales bacterium]|nr:aminotransferase class IV [Thermoflexales bacterium]
MLPVFELDPSGQPVPVPGDFASMTAVSAALPDGAYTTFRTYDGTRVLRLERHFDRLEDSLALMGTPARLDRAGARRVIAAAWRAGGFAEGRFRLTFSANPAPRFVAAAERFTGPSPEEVARGARCVTVRAERHNPHAKSTGFIAEAARQKGRLPAGVNEGLLVAEDGVILEGLSSNAFFIVGEELWTEEARALSGLTKALVLELAPAVGLAVHPHGLPLSNLATADECFITSVSREILPVVEIDGQPVGAGRPGPRTTALRQAWAAVITREAVDVFSEPAR